MILHHPLYLNLYKEIKVNKVENPNEYVAFFGLLPFSYFQGVGTLSDKSNPKKRQYAVNLLNESKIGEYKNNHIH